MDQLVSTEWLAAEREAPDLVVLDCTVFLQITEAGYVSESGRAKYNQAHIPRAQFADLNTDLVDAQSPYRYAIPKPEAFAAALQLLGVSDHSRVVLYDDNRAMWAARVWWMMRWIGFDNAALLDGGLKAWRAEGRELTDEATTPLAGSLSVRERPELIASKADVLDAIDDGATCLIDALSPESFRGETAVYGRPGHIPGATNAAAVGLIDDGGRFLARDVLAERFPADKATRIVNYCGGGIAASATAFAQTLLGYTDVAVYTHSLQEWASDPAAPMTV